MTTIQKLSAYRTALDKWANKKYTHELAMKCNKPPKKPLESEPSLLQFEIAPDDQWALKIRVKVTGNLERRLAAINNAMKTVPAVQVPQKSAIKIPTRK